VVDGLDPEIAHRVEHILEAHVPEKAELAEIQGGDVEQLLGLALVAQAATGDVAALVVIAAGLEAGLLGDQPVAQLVEAGKALGAGHAGGRAAGGRGAGGGGRRRDGGGAAGGGGGGGGVEVGGAAGGEARAGPGRGGGGVGAGRG